MSLDLVALGTLTRPGPIGRTVRFALGIFCTYALWELIRTAPEMIDNPLGLLPNLSVLIIFVLFVFNYVVNIGFSRNWHRYPLIVSLGILLVIALGGYILSGNSSTSLLGATLLFWLGYFYSHLGVSFILAGLLATPGCEMRAIPELIARITNRESREHHCPVGILTSIDKWERNPP